MTTPDNWSTVTVTGTYIGINGEPMTGTVRFSTPARLVDEEENIVIPATSITATLDEDGSFSVAVPASDDADFNAEFFYNVHERLIVPGAPAETSNTFDPRKHLRQARYAVQLPASPATVDVTDLVEVEPPGITSPYLTEADADAAYLALTGGTITGDLTVTGTLNADIDVDVDVDAADVDFTPTGTLAGTNVQTALAEAAAEAAQKSANLSDLANAGTARTNLGLGGAAVLNVGTTAGTVAAGDDSRITGAAQKSANLSDLSNAATARTNLSLGNVDNTSDLNKPISTATQTALDAKQALDADLTAIAALTPSNDDVVQRKSGAWTNRTMAQVKTDLALTKSDVGLGNVDNTSDANKPISTATQAALDGKQTTDADLTAIAALTPANDDVIQRKAGAWTNRTMAQVKTDLALTKADVGLGSVDNTADADKPVSTAQQAAIDAVATSVTDHIGDTSGAHAASAISFSATGTLASTDVQAALAEAASEAAQKASNLSDLANAGTARTNLGLGNVDNTSDANKPISTATQAALDAKQGLDSDLTAIAGLSPTNDDVIQRKSGAWTNRTMAQVKTDLALTKSDVGLGNVDNTADADKPVSTATQTALDAKQGLDADLTAIAGLSPTNDDVIQRKAGAWTNRTMAQVKTDLVLVKGDVGLGNVDNTSDANKPVSTATQTALDLKAPLASPALTGTPTAPTAAQATNSTQIATTAFVAVVQDRTDQIGPVEYSLIAWNIPWWIASTGTILATAGLVHVAKVHVPKATTITNVELCWISTAGSGLTSGQNFAALYSGAKALLSTTADQTTAWGSTGRKTAALGTPQAVSAGYVYVAWFANGSTLPTFVRASGQNAINGGLAAADSLWATADSGRTTSMPSTLGTFTGLGVSYAVGVS